MGGKEMNKIPKKFNCIQISKSIFDTTLHQLQKVGEDYKEGIAYWSGILNRSNGIIKNVIFADDYPEFHNEPYFANVSLETSFKIGEKIHQRNEFLFAQIHTHPSDAFHSFVDNNYPISHRIGFLSVVIPNFGKNIDSLQQCKIFEYKGKAKWDELKNNHILKKFEVTENG